MGKKTRRHNYFQTGSVIFVSRSWTWNDLKNFSRVGTSCEAPFFNAVVVRRRHHGRQRQRRRQHEDDKRDASRNLHFSVLGLKILLMFDTKVIWIAQKSFHHFASVADEEKEAGFESWLLGFASPTGACRSQTPSSTVMQLGLAAKLLGLCIFCDSRKFCTFSDWLDFGDSRQLRIKS